MYLVVVSSRMILLTQYSKIKNKAVPTTSNRPNAPAGPILFIRFVTLLTLNNSLSRAHLPDDGDEREKDNVRDGGVWHFRAVQNVHETTSSSQLVSEKTSWRRE